jgi:cytochrome o ubiquinol oxidase operon protein cyoD
MQAHDSERSKRRELRNYITGLGLALVLTAIPFGLVAWGGLPPATSLGWIAACGLLQGMVQLRYFLHIDFSRQKREDLGLILFSTLLLALMAGGTIWIVGSLNAAMQVTHG